jgi:hypothetical protein
MRPTPPTGFEALKAKGVTFQVIADGILHVAGPSCVLTPEVTAALGAQAPSIVQRLRQRPDLGGFPAQLPGLGPLAQDTEGPCGLCRARTRVSYGGFRRCRACAWDPECAAAMGLHRALIALWHLVAQGAAADPARIEWARQEIARWTSEIGVPRAAHLTRCLARLHWQATGMNPWSGQPDPDGRWLAS